MELPLATPEASAVHISAERYYAIPEMEIYKTYPPRMLGKTDAEYRVWLREQEPRRIRVEGLASKEDWIRAGEAVFDWPSTFTGEPPPGVSLRVAIRTKGKIEFGGLNCSSCHTRRLEDGREIRGAQMNLAARWKTAPPVTPPFWPVDAPTGSPI
jgi:hypothetical protein